MLISLQMNLNMKNSEKIEMFFFNESGQHHPVVLVNH